MTAAGTVASGFTSVKEPGNVVDCSYADPSPGAVDANIEECGPFPSDGEWPAKYAARGFFLVPPGSENAETSNPWRDLFAPYFETDDFTLEDAEALLAGEWDYVVDAIDNVKAKLHLLHQCVQRGIPVVSSMGAAGRLDPTYIRVDDLCETHMDPFAKDIRKLLKRKWNIDTNKPTGITAVFSIEPRRDPFDLKYDEAHGGFMCVCPHGENEFHSCEHRNQIDGSVAFVTSIFGMQMAGVVIRRVAQGR